MKNPQNTPSVRQVLESIVGERVHEAAYYMPRPMFLKLGVGRFSKYVYQRDYEHHIQDGNPLIRQRRYVITMEGSIVLSDIKTGTEIWRSDDVLDENEWAFFAGQPHVHLRLAPYLMGSYITSATEDSGVVHLEFDSGVTIIQIVMSEGGGEDEQEREYHDCCRVMSWDTLSMHEITASSIEHYPIPDAYSAVRNLDTGEVIC